MKKRILKTVITIVIIFIGIIVFSPYKYDSEKQCYSIESSIKINQPVGKVFSYLGNSKNAKDWSVYVDHITALNSEKIPDGKVGSTRRCFKNANEKGITWDEEITECIPNKKRQLSIYNPKNFLMMTNGLMTEQIYHPIDHFSTKLTFKVFNKNPNPGIVAEIKTHIASYYISYIFEKNIKNIKNLTEHGKLN